MLTCHCVWEKTTLSQSKVPLYSSKHSHSQTRSYVCSYLSVVCVCVTPATSAAKGWQASWLALYLSVSVYMVVMPQPFFVYSCWAVIQLHTYTHTHTGTVKGVQRLLLHYGHTHMLFCFALLCFIFYIFPQFFLLPALHLALSFFHSLSYTLLL